MEFFSLFEKIDFKIEKFFLSLQNPFLVKFFFWVSLLGEWQIIFFLSLLILIFIFKSKRKKYLLPFFVTLFLAPVFTQFIKILVQRPRPNSKLYFESSFSFPSTHATIAIAFYGFLFSLFLKKIKSKKKKILLFSIFLLFVFLIGLSRLYLGVHYLSDVLVGYILGIFWLILAILISKKFCGD